MEAVVWTEILKMFPESNNLESALVTRENILKQLLEKAITQTNTLKRQYMPMKGIKIFRLLLQAFLINKE